jgi:hypothetical protein
MTEALKTLTRPLTQLHETALHEAEV